jgi:CHRD domain
MSPEGNNTTLSVQLNNILTGHSYINFHTNQFSTGEIRGTIVPEASSTRYPCWLLRSWLCWA